MIYNVSVKDQASGKTAHTSISSDVLTSKRQAPTNELASDTVPEKGEDIGKPADPAQRTPECQLTENQLPGGKPFSLTAARVDMPTN
ncbi:hypothetical protein BYT27DRAFT_7261935 [Phlegmacium glaucopus]|nr:hypothetical protein BYT27DRAFT_7261935 [Phlegmacium glaucopus]